MPSLLRIQVLTDDIFRISATPARSFTEHASLSVILKPDMAKKWAVTESDSSLEITTLSTRVHVSLKTGQVTFMNKDGISPFTGNKRWPGYSQIQPLMGHTAILMRQSI